MKKSLLLFTSLTLALTTFSQAKVSYSEEIPETASTTGKALSNPRFSNSVMAYIAHGLTVFKQTKELYLVDKTSLKISKKILYPKYEGYDDADDLTSIMVDLKGGEVCLYKKKINKRYEVSGVKIDESFAPSSAPSRLFSCRNLSKIKYTSDETGSICVFSSEEEIQKTNYFFYWVMDNNLKLLKSDSIAFDLKEDIMSVAPMENGYALSKSGANTCEITIFNFKTNKSVKTTINSGTKKLTAINGRILSGSKVVLCGNYFYPDKKEYKNGVFKIVANADNGAVDEQVLFDNIPAGKDEEEKLAKQAVVSRIDEKGTCYIILNQEKYDGFRNKLELFCISGTAKWKKQLPHPAYNNPNYKPTMFLFKNELYITYTDYEADKPVLDYMDYNNYVFGSPRPSVPVTERQVLKGHTTILAFSPEGKVKAQHLVGVMGPFEYVGNGVLMGVCQGLNGQITSKCKIGKIDLN